MLVMIKDGKGCMEDEGYGSNGISVHGFKKILEDKGVSMESQESRSVIAANTLMAKLRAQLEPFRVITDERTPWEERSAAVRLSDKVGKHKRNKLWRKRKRKRIAEMRAKVVSFLPLFCFFGLMLDRCLFCFFAFIVLTIRSVNYLNKLIKKLMNGGLGRLLMILQSARYWILIS
jgi:hypothetical protein